MKKTAGVLQSLVLSGLLIILTTTCYAQNKKEEKEVATAGLLESKRYEFVAQSMTPHGGRLRQLTSYYNVIITPDSVNADLPYVGRAYSASVSTTDVGIKFISTEFDYTSKDRKKGGWDVTIKPKGVTDVQQLFFTVYKDGTAYLQVTSNNRQGISFNGHVQPVNDKKQ